MRLHGCKLRDGDGCARTTDPDRPTGPGQDLQDVYFPFSGLISIVALMANGDQIETATVTREGMVGLSVYLGDPLSQYRVMAQIPGRGVCLPAGDFLSELERHGRLLENMGRYTQVRLAMTGQNAACNAAHSIRERLARWLLICHDSVDADSFFLTQEFLSQMLGTERTTVTEQAGLLQRSGVITYHRGKVQILDRAELERRACECYAAVKAETNRLLGPSD